MRDSYIENFVKAWVAQNLTCVPRPGNVLLEVDRLAAELTGAARAEGISGKDIHGAFGDIDDYLMEQCRQGSAPPSSS